MRSSTAETRSRRQCPAHCDLGQIMLPIFIYREKRSDISGASPEPGTHAARLKRTIAVGQLLNTRMRPQQVDGGEVVETLTRKRVKFGFIVKGD